MNELIRLKINRCTPQMQVQKKAFTVMLNPGSVKHSTGIDYNKKKGQGAAASQLKFASVGEETLSFSIVIDATGAVPSESSGGTPGVAAQLRLLNGVVYDYDGIQHEPSNVRVLWGQLIFFGRLTRLETEFTLFKPSGDPLRAKVSLSFLGAISKDAEKLVANRSSPDLSHVVEVRDGDTLPLLCQRIYGDDAYYMDVARFNGLPALRSLKPGTTLQFPPLA